MSHINASSYTLPATGIARLLPPGGVDVDNERTPPSTRSAVAAAAGDSLVRDIEQSLRRAEARLRAAACGSGDLAADATSRQVDAEAWSSAYPPGEEAGVLAAAVHLAASARGQRMDALCVRMRGVDPLLLSVEAETELRASCAHALHAMPALPGTPATPFSVATAGFDPGCSPVADAEIHRESSGSTDQQTAGWQHDLFDDIFKLIQRLDAEWLTRFSDILSNYVSFFQTLTNAMSGLKDAIKGPGKDGALLVDFGDVVRELQALRNNPSELNLGGNFDHHADAEAFLKELGLDGINIVMGSGGTWHLAMDPASIDRLIGTFPIKNGGGNLSLNPSAYAAIISAKDSLMERFNHINRVLPDKYQRQLQTWDTLVKTLSGTIDAMAEATRLIMQNIS